MKSIRFERWCSVAVGRIRFGPDRKEVYEELYAHMEDQYEELIDAGMTEGDAEAGVAASMGDPQETAYQLEMLYRPFWGYALRIARWCLLAAALLVLFTVPRYIRGLGINELSPGVNACYEGDREDEYGVDRLVYYAEPMVKARSDGYAFTVTRVAERRRFMKDNSEYDNDDFYIQVEVSALRPWGNYCDVLREFTAVDSLGNVYGAFNHTPTAPDSMKLSGNQYRTGIFTYTWSLWLWGYCSQEAEWIELRYQKSGRDLRLTIDLSDRRRAEA